ncbi:hypothetical protein ACFLW5_02515 [Chloroflexota bacterium]
MNNHKRLKDTRTLVAEIFFTHPDWNARQIYDRYLLLVDPKNAVTLNAIQKHVEKLKYKWNEIQKIGIDTPWSLGKTLDLPAEAVDAIFRVQKWAEKDHIEQVYKDTRQGIANRFGVTIRQAFWIARLYKYAKSTSFLWVASFIYAVYELKWELSEQSEQPLNTWQLDSALREGYEAFRLLGANILSSNFEEEFQLHMAEERVPLIEVKSWKELAQEAREELKKRELEKEGEK